MSHRLPSAAAPGGATRRRLRASALAVAVAIGGAAIASLTATAAAAQAPNDGWAVDMGSRPAPLDPAFAARQPAATATAPEAWSAPGQADPWSVSLYFGGGPPGYGWYGGGWPYGPQGGRRFQSPFYATHPSVSVTPYGVWGGAWTGAGVWPYAGFAIGSGE